MSVDYPMRKCGYGCGSDSLWRNQAFSKASKSAGFQYFIINTYLQINILK